MNKKTRNVQKKHRKGRARIKARQKPVGRKKKAAKETAG